MRLVNLTVRFLAHRLAIWELVAILQEFSSCVVRTTRHS